MKNKKPCGTLKKVLFVTMMSLSVSLLGGCGEDIENTSQNVETTVRAVSNAEAAVNVMSEQNDDKINEADNILEEVTQ